MIGRATTVVLRRLRWWQLDQVLAIEADLFGDEQWTPAMFWNELAYDHYYVAALTAQDEVVGYGGVAVVRPEAWINNIAVRRDRQRTGIGRQLLDELLGYAISHGATHTLLEVAADNAAAQRMYDSYRFGVIGVRRGYYQPSNTDALVMRRDEPSPREHRRAARPEERTERGEDSPREHRRAARPEERTERGEDSSREHRRAARPEERTERGEDSSREHRRAARPEERTEHEAEGAQP